MPFADPERAKQYSREYRRLRRAGNAGSPPGSAVAIPIEVRCQTAQDVIEILEGQIEAVLGDAALGTTDRARTIGFLASVSLRAIEAGNLAARIEALESVLKNRDKR